MSRLDNHDKYLLEKDRRNKKSSAITDGQYVDGSERKVTQGKGDKYRPISGWYSEEITERLNKIFGKKNTKTKSS